MNVLSRLVSWDGFGSKGLDGGTGHLRSKSGDDAGSLNHLVVAQLSKTKMCAMSGEPSLKGLGLGFEGSQSQ